MKTRTGFVSNSSTSSFVALGFYLTEEEEKAMSQQRQRELEEAKMFLYNEPHSLIGQVLAHQDTNYHLEFKEIDISELVITTRALAENFGVDVSRIKLLTGVHLS
jgi:hypothetical protein